MSGRKKAEAAVGPLAPAYIVTFSDMVTLLLTFFVLLVSMSKMQDSKFIGASRDAFVNSIRYMGLGLVLGKDLTPDFGEVKDKYFITEPESTIQVRTIDAREEDVRRMFKQISESVRTMRSPLKTEATSFSVMDVKFAAGTIELDEAGRNFLKNYAINLQQSCPAGSVKLYIVAMANDVSDKKQQWLVSAKRAQRVEAFLRSSLPAGFNCPIYSSGAGAKSDSLKADAPAAGSQVLIAVLRSGER